MKNDVGSSGQGLPNRPDFPPGLDVRLRATKVNMMVPYNSLLRAGDGAPTFTLARG